MKGKDVQDIAGNYVTGCFIKYAMKDTNRKILQFLPKNKLMNLHYQDRQLFISWSKNFSVLNARQKRQDAFCAMNWVKP